MSQRSDDMADRLMEGLSTRGIYHLAWTLLKARLGIGLGIGLVGILVSLIVGSLFGLFFLLVGG